MKRWFLFFFCVLFCFQSRAQNDTNNLAGTSRKYIKRRILVGGASAAFLAGSLVLFSKTSDNKYHKNFSVIDDSRAWMQVDKMEHSFIAYTANRFLYSSWRWAGLSKNGALALSSASTFAYLGTKEYLDGHKINWGWSWSDMAANALGISLFSFQEIVWGQQKIQYKFSTFPQHTESSLETRSNRLFGESLPEQLLKNHNLQTYWLSFNLNSLTNVSSIPSWLNIAVGYGAANMYGTFENVEYTNAKVIFDRSDLRRNRQWYISPDIDLTRIRIKSKLLKTLLFAFNSIKFPLPGLEYSDHKLRAHLLVF